MKVNECGTFGYNILRIPFLANRYIYPDMILYPLPDPTLLGIYAYGKGSTMVFYLYSLADRECLRSYTVSFSLEDKSHDESGYMIRRPSCRSQCVSQDGRYVLLSSISYNNVSMLDLLTGNVVTFYVTPVIFLNDNRLAMLKQGRVAVYSLGSDGLLRLEEVRANVLLRTARYTPLMVYNAKHNKLAIYLRGCLLWDMTSGEIDVFDIFDGRVVGSLLYIDLISDKYCYITTTDSVILDYINDYDCVEMNFFGLNSKRPSKGYLSRIGNLYDFNPNSRLGIYFDCYNWYGHIIDYSRLICYSLCPPINKRNNIVDIVLSYSGDYAYMVSSSGILYEVLVRNVPSFSVDLTDESR